MSSVNVENSLDVIKNAMTLELAAIREENVAKTRQTAAKEQLASAIRDSMGEVLAEMQSATYVDSRGKIVVSATKLYDSLYTSEFGGVFKTDSNTPQEWQFARIVVGLLRKAVARMMKAANADEAKAAWRAFAGTRNIGVNVESVPSTNVTIDSLAEALANLL